MKNLILASAILASLSVVSSARADVQAYSPNYTCAALQQLVATSGRTDIQMAFGYAVYAPNASYCYSDERTGGGTVFGTQDKAFCNVGVVCDEINNGGGNG